MSCFYLIFLKYWYARYQMESHFQFLFYADKEGNKAVVFLNGFRVSWVFRTWAQLTLAKITEWGTQMTVYNNNVVLSEKTFCLPCFLYLTSNQTGIGLYQENYICNTGLHPFLQPKTWPRSWVFHFRSFAG